MKNNKVLSFLSNYWQIILISFIFLCYQLFVSSTLWNRLGNIPPGFGDSLGYIFGIEKVIKYHSLFPQIPYFGNYTFQPAHFSYFSYNIILGFIGTILKTSGFYIFFYSFFIGKLILLLSCIFLLKYLLGESKYLLSLSLLFLGIFVGDGGIHGFFWVVPSFWMLVLFFFLIGIINSPQKIKILPVFLLCLLYITIHPLSIFSIFIFTIYTLLHFYFSKNIPKKAISVTVMLVISAILWQVFIFTISRINRHPKTTILTSNPQTLTQSIEEIKEISNDAQTNSALFVATNIKEDEVVQQVSNSAPSLPQVRIFDELLKRNSETTSTQGTSIIPAWNGYFSWFFRLPFLLILLLVGIFISIKKRRWSLISLYLSCLSFTLVSLINPMGYRSILFLFPVTIIFLSTTLYDLISFLYKNKKRFYRPISYFLFFLVLIGLTGYAFYGFETVKYYSTIADYIINPTECIDYIKNFKPQETKIYFTSIEGINYFINQGIEKYQLAGINNFENPNIEQNILLITENYDTLDKSDINLLLPDPKNIISLVKNNIAQTKQFDCGIFQLFDITQVPLQ
jgi:hypothetical protein